MESSHDPQPETRNERNAAPTPLSRSEDLASDLKSTAKPEVPTQRVVTIVPSPQGGEEGEVATESSSSRRGSVATGTSHPSQSQSAQPRSHSRSLSPPRRDKRKSSSSKRVVRTVADRGASPARREKDIRDDRGHRRRQDSSQTRSKKRARSRERDHRGRRRRSSRSRSRSPKSRSRGQLVSLEEMMSRGINLEKGVSLPPARSGDDKHRSRRHRDRDRSRSRSTRSRSRRTERAASKRHVRKKTPQQERRWFSRSPSRDSSSASRSGRSRSRSRRSRSRSAKRRVVTKHR